MLPEYYNQHKYNPFFLQLHFPGLAHDLEHEEEHKGGLCVCDHETCNELFVISHESHFYYAWSAVIVAFCYISSIIYVNIAAFPGCVG